MHELALNSVFLGASVHSLECFLLVSYEDLMNYAPKLWRLESPVDPATGRIFLESLESILQIWKEKLTCGWFVQNSCVGELLAWCALALAFLHGMKTGKWDPNSLKHNWRDAEFLESLQFGFADLLLHALGPHWDVQIDGESQPKNHREHLWLWSYVVLKRIGRTELNAPWGIETPFQEGGKGFGPGATPRSGGLALAKPILEAAPLIEQPWLRFLEDFFFKATGWCNCINSGANVGVASKRINPSIFKCNVMSCCMVSFCVCACASAWARSISWKERYLVHVIPLIFTTNSRASSQIGQRSLFLPIVKSRWKLLIKDPNMCSSCLIVDTLHRSQISFEETNNHLSIGSSCSVTMYCVEVEASWSGRHGNHGSR